LSRTTQSCADGTIYDPPPRHAEYDSFRTLKQGIAGMVLDLLGRWRAPACNVARDKGRRDSDEHESTAVAAEGCAVFQRRWRKQGSDFSLPCFISIASPVIQPCDWRNDEDGRTGVQSISSIQAC
jgi:hypothetical protein